MARVQRGLNTMRQFVIATVVAVGLPALWAGLLPLTAEPATKHVAAASPAMSKSLFLCHGPNGLNQACAAALAKALVRDVTVDAPARIGEQSCPADQKLLVELHRKKPP